MSGLARLLEIQGHPRQIKLHSVVFSWKEELEEEEEEEAVAANKKE